MSEYSAEERSAILERMTNASHAFYAAAARAGCHAFLEFSGLHHEFIRMCADAELVGRPWVTANKHTEGALAMTEWQRHYIDEKLECIFGFPLASEAGPVPSMGRPTYTELARLAARALSALSALERHGFDSGQFYETIDRCREATIAMEKRYGADELDAFLAEAMEAQ